MSYGIISRLNENQNKAAKTIYGPHIVIAGAGTGKTQVLAARIANMRMSDAMINPGNILALTFTEAGVVAMRKRLVSVMGTEAYKVSIHTFHSFCNEIIQSNPSYFAIREFEPVSELEQIEIAYRIIDRLPAKNPLKRLSGNPYYEAHRLLRAFQTCKDEGWDVEKVKNAIEDYIADLPNQEAFIYKRANAKKGIKVGDLKKHLIQQEVDKMEMFMAAVVEMETYDRMLRELKRYDFSDMISWVLNAFQNDEQFLLNYQERYQFLLVDEFQDTNGSQLELIDVLMNFWDNPNIFVVGDDDQCLYEFNGARLKNVIDFKDRYKPEIVVLDQNYRSVQSILDSASSVISENAQRLINQLPGLTKALKANVLDEEWDEDTTPVVLEFSNPAQEATFVSNHIRELLDSGFPANEIAVLYRKHKQGELILHQLQMMGIPVNIKKRLNVLDTIIVKQLLGILEYVVSYSALDRKTQESMLFNILHYNILSADIKEIHAYYLKKVSDKEVEKPKTMVEIEELLELLIFEYNNRGLVDFFYSIINHLGIITYIISQADLISLSNYVNSFLSWVKGESLKRSDLNGDDLLGMVDKMRQNGLSVPVQYLYSSEDGVNLMTVHGSKGLEFEKVMIIGCSRGEWEASRSGSNMYKIPDTLTFSGGEDKLESNRRLFYVAMTRAKKELIISYPAQTEEGKNLEPSQFIAETKLEIKQAPPVMGIDEYIVNAIQNPILDLEQINREILLERVENITLSISYVNSYLHCPVAFYYEKVLRVPSPPKPALLFGNAIHNSLRKIYESYKEGFHLSWDEFFGVFKDYMEKNQSQFEENEFVRRMELGERDLKAFYTETFPGSAKITLNEFHIQRVVINDVPFKGDIDKIEFDGSIIDISDYKTGNLTREKYKVEAPSDKNPDGGDHWRQIVAYKLMIDQIPGKNWIFRKGRIDFLTEKGAIKFPVEVTDQDERMVEKQIKLVYDSIHKLEFNQGCGDENCVWCNLQKEYQSHE